MTDFGASDTRAPRAWMFALAASVVCLSSVALPIAAARSGTRWTDASGVNSEDEYFDEYHSDGMEGCDACDLDCDGSLSESEADTCPLGFTATPQASTAPPSAGDVRGSVSPSPDASSGFRLTEFMPLREIGLLYRHAVARGKAASLRVLGSASGWTLVVGGDRASAARVADSLGWTSTSVQPLGSPQSELTPTILTTTVEANIRTGPSTTHEVAGVVPAKSLVIAFLGSLEGVTGEYGRPGTWVFVSASRDDAGWMAGALLESYDGCVPDVAALLGAAPTIAALGESPLLLSTRIREAMGWQAVIVAVARDPERRQSFVGVFPRVSPACQLGAARVITVSSYVAQMVLFELSRESGPTALALGTHPEWAPSSAGLLNWRVYASGDLGDAIWSQRVANSVLRPSRSERIRFQRGDDGGTSASYFPLVVTRSGQETRYEYIGGVLAEANP